MYRNTAHALRRGSSAPRALTLATVLLALALLMPAPARAQSTIFVDADAASGGDGASWATAYIDLQDALSVAVAGDEIWVAEGTYKPTSGTDRTIYFELVSDVVVFGGFAGTESARDSRDWVANATVLDGDIGASGDNTDNSHHVVYHDADGNATVLDGFHITGGKGGSGPGIGFGGGVFSLNGSPTFANLRIYDNHSLYGAGIGLAGQSGSNSPRFHNVAIYDNHAVLHGGGAYTGELANPEFVNVTFFGNSAANNGGAIYENPVHDGGTTLVNCILWDNGTDPIDPPDDVTATYSLIEGGFPGTGNIDADPLFVDADGADNVLGTLDDDLRLSDTSPAIDAGDNASVPAGLTTDLDGSPRFVDHPVADTGSGTAPLVDMGAYEAQLKDATPFLAAANPGDTVALPAGTYQGGLTIDKPLTLKADGDVIIGPGSPGMIITADGVTIDGLIFDGTGCTEATDVGISVQAANQVWIRNTEVRDWCGHGIAFGGAAAEDVKLIDNYIHDNGSHFASAGNGVNLWNAPLGTVQIYGNRFRDNKGDGIIVHNDGDSVKLDARWNDWGSKDGPHGANGDGVDDLLVAWDPYLYAALWAKQVVPAGEVNSWVEQDAHSIDSIAYVLEDGGTIETQFRLGAQSLYGVEFDVSYDPALLEILATDIDSTFKTTGRCEVDATTTAGLVRYDCSRQALDVPFDVSNDWLLNLTFQAKPIGSALVSTSVGIVPASTWLGAPAGVRIVPKNTWGATVNIIGRTDVDGVVDLQGRDDDTGAEVDPTVGVTHAYDPPPDLTDAWGEYDFAQMWDDTYTFTVKKDLYLDATRTYVVTGGTMTLDPVTLLGGNAVDDPDPLVPQVIDLDDVLVVAGAFRTVVGDPDWDPDADFNANGRIGILDLVILAGNYGKSSSPW